MIESGRIYENLKMIDRYKWPI